MHCICSGWHACQRTCWLADALRMGLMRIEADGFANEFDVDRGGWV